MYSEMILPTALTELPPKITEITGIEYSDLKAYGKLPGTVLANVHDLFSQAEAVVAHNGNLFDRPIFEANFKHNTDDALDKFLWIDTSCDIEFPADMKTRTLKHLCAEHGFLNPFSHRALFDVLSMLKVCDQYSWDKIIASARTPNLIVRAVMPFTKDEMFGSKVAEFKAMKDKISGAGFRFDFEAKEWTKSIKEYNKDAAKAEAATGGYRLTLIRKEEPNV
jgi:hypothetical protein